MVVVSTDGFKRYLDMTSHFLQADGTVSKEIMPDGVHLSDKGYQIWADTVAGPLDQLMKAE